MSLLRVPFSWLREFQLRHPSLQGHAHQRLAVHPTGVTEHATLEVRAGETRRLNSLRLLTDRKCRHRTLQRGQRTGSMRVCAGISARRGFSAYHPA